MQQKFEAEEKRREEIHRLEVTEREARIRQAETSPQHLHLPPRNDLQPVDVTPHPRLLIDAELVVVMDGRVGHGFPSK